MASPVERYIAAVRETLRHDPLLARRVCEEVGDHLAEVVAEGRRQGMSQHDAEQQAVHRFGSPETMARQFDRYTLPIKLLLVSAALATAAVALWLGFVITVILPSRDPQHIPMWSAFAAGFLGYSALTLAFVVAGPRPRFLPAAVVVGSLAAIAFGGYAIFTTWNAAHFEGYPILMGAVLAGHGVCALGYTALTARIARRIRTA